jgi:hypothetical protein
MTSTADVVNWVTARQLLKHLQGIHSRTTSLWVSQGVVLRNTLAEFLADPRSEDWIEVRDAVAGTLREVEKISDDLNYESTEYSTLPFYADMALSLAERKRTLTALLALDPPKTPEQLSALRAFLERYVILIEKLGELNKILAAHIERLKADGKWPIRGD